MNGREFIILKLFRVLVYSSNMLPIVITNTQDANEMYEKMLGTELLSIPRGDANRLKRWPKLQDSESIEINAQRQHGETCGRFEVI